MPKTLSQPNLLHLLTPLDLKLEKELNKKSASGHSLNNIQKILGKTKVSLTRLIIAEREKNRW